MLIINIHQEKLYKMGNHENTKNETKFRRILFTNPIFRDLTVPYST